MGVDAHLVGTWDLPFKGGRWVLTIRRVGTYQFHSEAHDGAKPHSGTFSAGNGHWAAAWFRPASPPLTRNAALSAPEQTLIHGLSEH